MANKRTNKPISVLVIGMPTTLALEALREQGHTVFNWTPGVGSDPEGYDVIVGPKCWRWLPEVSEKWLPQLLKEARAAQPKSVKKGTKHV